MGHLWYQKWDTSGTRNGTLGSLRILELSTSNKDWSVAFFMTDCQTYNKVVMFRRRRERWAYLAVPKGTRNGTLYLGTGQPSLTSSVFDEQASNSLRM